jgi:hypothetical protein
MSTNKAKAHGIKCKEMDLNDAAVKMKQLQQA